MGCGQFEAYIESGKLRFVSDGKIVRQVRSARLLLEEINPVDIQARSETLPPR